MYTVKEFDINWRSYVPEKKYRQYMNDFECSIICYYAQKSNGNIIEIGCNEGNTTKDIALSCPDKIIYAIDTYTSTNKIQQVECPQEIGKYVKEFKNVQIIERENFDKIKYENIGCCFIDGDHSYEGVKKDYEFAKGLIKKGFILLHDYREIETHDWVGVSKLVNEIKDKEEIVFYKESMLVVITI